MKKKKNISEAVQSRWQYGDLIKSLTEAEITNFVKSVRCNFEKVDISYSQRNLDYFLVIRKKMQLCNGMSITLNQGHSYYH